LEDAFCKKIRSFFDEVGAVLKKGVGKMSRAIFDEMEKKGGTAATATRLADFS
jgi:hypothetical protein